MKIITIIGTRPEIIRLSCIIPLLDKYTKNIIVHTGQNYDYELDKIFFKNFKLRQPDYHLSARGSFGLQLSVMFKELELIFKKEKPDSLLVLGDTNSSLSSIIAKRYNIKIFHMEAGNRCYHEIVPEEINRKIIDHSSDILLPYTFRSCENLCKEGIDRKKIFITGNPIYEVLKKNENKINNSKILSKLKIKKNKYFLVTLHREENVDNKKILATLIDRLDKISVKYDIPIVWPIHPRTKNNIIKLKIKTDIKKLFLIKPLDFFDFIRLEKNAKCVLTDSGTVQEECSIFKIPVLTLRESTERPETQESGSNIIIGINSEDFIKALEFSINSLKDNIKAPYEYLEENVSDKILKILLSSHL